MLLLHLVDVFPEMNVLENLVVIHLKTMLTKM